MEPPLSNWILGGGALALTHALGFTLAWSRETLAFAVRNHPPAEEPDAQMRRILELWDLPHGAAALSLARLGVALCSFLIFWLLAFDPSATLSSWHWQGWVLLCGMLTAYLSQIVLPQIIAKAWPYAYWGWGLLAYQFALLTFGLWARLQTQFSLWVSQRLASTDPRLSFLTPSERERMEGEDSEEDSDALDAEERQMIRNIFDWSETPASEVMTPRGEMICLDVETPLQETIDFLNRERLSRVPVYRDNLDDMIGILHAKDFFHWYSTHPDESFSLAKLSRPALCVERGRNLSELMQEFRRTKTHLAVLTDEYGGTVGLVTLEDLIEVIVGEIYDEDDEDELMLLQVRPGTYVADPGILLDDLAEALERPIPIEEGIEIDTLSGLLQWRCGVLPRKGTVIDYQGLRIKVLKMEDNKIVKVLIELSPNMGPLVV